MIPSGIGGAVPEFLAIAAASYLLGSVPFGLVLTRLMGLGDLRAIGSGNIGATNVMRTGSRLAGFLTVLLDAGKGALPVLAAGAYLGSEAAQIAALSAFIGHLHPVWLRFRGGKGVATYLGILAAFSVPAGLLACLTWLAVFAAFRISSAGSIAASLLAPVWLLLFAGSETVAATAVMSAWILLRHHQNIRRLLAGTEPRISLTGKSGNRSGQ